MKKCYLIKAAFLLFSMLLLLTAWLSYRNFGTVTYTYRLENKAEKSDYRFFQYVPGDRVRVETDREGLENSPTVAVERVKYGTAVLIEGHDLGWDTPVQNITLTFHVDFLGLKTKTSAIEPYWNWVEEYPVRAQLPLRVDRMVCGDKAVIDVEEMDAEYQYEYKNLLRALLGLLLALVVVLLGFRRCLVRWSKSGSYAVAFLEKKGTEYGAEHCAEHLEEDRRIGEACYEQYMWELGRTYLIFVVFLCTVYMVALPYVLETQSVFWGLVVCLVISGAWYITAVMKSYKKPGELLTESCRPQAAAIALTECYGTRQIVRLRLKSNYGYQSLISCCFYYEGAFRQALEHLELVWEETPGLIRRSVHQIHYHIMRMECLKRLGYEAEVEQERQIIEEYLQNHPKHENSVYAKSYRREERIAALLESGDDREAERLLKEDAGSDKPRYIQVEAHYRLWCIARSRNSQEEMRIHEEFISRYGRELFFYDDLQKSH